MKRLLLLTIDLDNNSLGRTYCLWLLARSLGWDATVVAPRGERIWHPLAGSDFAASCQLVAPSRADQLVDMMRECDLVIAVKPLRESFGRALRALRVAKKPLLVDIDDPDLEVRLATGHPFKGIGKSILRPSEFWPAAFLRTKIESFPVLVSNPTLQRRYGGSIIPHVREDSGIGAIHTSWNPSIAFVGTARRHKGIDMLRRAVADLAPTGVTLSVTDYAPPDAKPWETWVGATSVEHGATLLRNSDIVVLPSLRRDTFAPAQLPAKLIDAMIAGRAIAVANMEPMTWALAGTGLSFESGDLNALKSAIMELASPERRNVLGASARARALEHFTVTSQMGNFKRACELAISTFP